MAKSAGYSRSYRARRKAAGGPLGSPSSQRNKRISSGYAAAVAAGIVGKGAKTPQQQEARLARALDRRISLQPQLSRGQRMANGQYGGETSALAANTREINLLSRALYG